MRLTSPLRASAWRAIVANFPLAIAISLIAAVVPLLLCLPACTRRQADMKVLFVALSKNDTAAFNIEFEKGFAPDRLNQIDGQSDLTILHAAAQDGNTEIVKILLTAGVKPDLSLKTGETPLILASAFGHTNVARILLDKGAAVEAGGESRLGTPLVTAAQGGHLETVRLLLERGSNVNAHSGVSTPLSLAAHGGHKDVVEFLLHSGAQPDYVTANMIRKDHPEIARMLQAADPIKLLLERTNAAQAKQKRLHAELAAFLRNSANTGILDKEKLAQYQDRARRLQAEFQGLLGTPESRP